MALVESFRGHVAYGHGPSKKIGVLNSVGEEKVLWIISDTSHSRVKVKHHATRGLGTATRPLTQCTIKAWPMFFFRRSKPINAIIY